VKSPIVFRASFEQPIGMWKIPGPIWVEIFHAKIGPPAEWKARRPGTSLVFEKITPQATPRELRNQIAGVFFEKQLTDWQAFDITTPGKPELLQSDEWATDSQGKVHITELRRQRKSEALIAAKKAYRDGGDTIGDSRDV
jgi:hypothetical protein